jgi:hypothetical protein
VVKLATERKHLTDIIKMVAYQAESDLLALLRPQEVREDQWAWVPLLPTVARSRKPKRPHRYDSSTARLEPAVTTSQPDTVSPPGVVAEPPRIS